MTIPNIINEWRKGCSCAPDDAPAECAQCTAAAITAIENEWNRLEAIRIQRVININSTFGKMLGAYPVENGTIIMPPNIHFNIERNPHAAVYEDVKTHCAPGQFIEPDDFDSPEDFKEACDTGELWTLQLYPKTPVGFWTCAAPTLQKLIALAWKLHNQP